MGCAKFRAAARHDLLTTSPRPPGMGSAQSCLWLKAVQITRNPGGDTLRTAIRLPAHRRKYASGYPVREGGSEGGWVVGST